MHRKRKENSDHCLIAKFRPVVIRKIWLVSPFKLNEAIKFHSFWMSCFHEKSTELMEKIITGTTNIASTTQT